MNKYGSKEELYPIEIPGVKNELLNVGYTRIWQEWKICNCLQKKMHLYLYPAKIEWRKCLTATTLVILLFKIQYLSYFINWNTFSLNLKCLQKQNAFNSATFIRTSVFRCIIAALCQQRTSFPCGIWKPTLFNASYSVVPSIFSELLVWNHKARYE